MCNVIAAWKGKPSEEGREEGGNCGGLGVFILFYQQIQISLGVLHFCAYMLWYLEVLNHFCSKWKNIKLF